MVFFSGSAGFVSFFSRQSFIFAGTDWGSVFLSSNNGSSWTAVNNGLPIGIEVLPFAISGSNIFAGTDSGIFLSVNNGMSWMAVDSGLPNSSINSLAISGNNIFAGTEHGVYLSSDNGVSWNHTVFNNRIVYSIAISGNNIFAGTSNNGVYRSANNGVSWDQTALNNRSVYSVAVSSNNLFAGTDSHGVYISANNGISWNQASLNDHTVLFLSANGNRILTGTKDSGVYASINNGVSWEKFNGGFSTVSSVYSLLLTGNNIFAGTRNYSVWKRNESEIGIKNISISTPDRFILYNNYPNPFNPLTKIRFDVPESEHIVITVFDVLGREVASLVNEQLQPGTYEIEWDGSNYPSGVYFYKFSAGIDIFTKSMVLIK